MRNYSILIPRHWSIPILLSAFLFLISHTITAQSNNTSILYKQLDDLHQLQNQEIINGVEYRETYRTINEKHSFLKGRDFYPATLVYDNQFYPDTPIRYDIFRDIIVANIKSSSGQVYVMELISDLVTQFTLDGQKFVNFTFADDPFDKGLYEVLAETKCAYLLKKRRFRPLEKRDRSFLYYEFEELSTQRIIKFSNFSVEASKKDIIKKFPDHKKNIKSFYRSKRSLRKSNKDKFYQEMMIMLSEINCDKKI